MIAPADRAPQSTPIESVPVETTENVQGLKSIVTDEKGFAKLDHLLPEEVSRLRKPKKILTWGF